MEFDISWLKGTQIDEETGLNYTGSPDRYVSVLRRFYGNYEKNRAKVEETLAAKDYENYMIAVHALKSNSRMIGASRLGDMFEKLEMASRSGEYDLLEKETAPTLEAYAKVIEELSPLAELESSQPAEEIGEQEAKKIIEQLMDALDDFDDGQSRDLVRQLSGYPFGEVQAAKLKKATDLIEDFLYEDAIELIRELDFETK